MDARAVGALPAHTIGHGRGPAGRGEAADVPRGGAGLAGQRLLSGGRLLADHANTIAVAGELTNGRHSRQ